MLGDLLVVGEGTQLSQVELDRVVDQAVDPQAVVGEVAFAQLLELVSRRVRAVVPEVRRDVLLGVLARLRVEVLEQSLGRPDEGVSDLLHLARVTVGERRGATHQATIMTTSETAKIQKPTQLSSSRLAYMWFRLRSAPVVRTRVT